jgi:phage baseplate assembly protein W
MTRYKDLDLTLMPNPSSLERYKGVGVISYNTHSTIVIGSGTEFTRYLTIDDNLYVSNSFIGKIKTIISDTELELYATALFSTSVTMYDKIDKEISSKPESTSSTKLNNLDEKYTLSINADIIQEGAEIIFTLITENIPDGTIIPYNIIGIDPSSVYFEPLEGEMVIYNNMDYVRLKTRSDDITQIVQNVIMYLVGRTIHSNNMEYRFATPADIMFKTNNNAVSTSIKHLIQTINFERPFNSKLGSQCMNLLFDNPSLITNLLIKRTISDVIRNYEPRANVMDISVDSIEHNYNITITYYITESTVPITLDLSLERMR